MQFRKDIQGLRFLAILLVFLFHLSPKFLSGGFIGVDVFFVISGYLVITNINNKILFDQFNLINYLKGRITRIVPAYFLMLVITSFFIVFIYYNFDVGKILRKELLFVITFLSNLFFKTSSDYFGASSQENPFLHTWSLGIEMQFYLLFPIFLLVLRYFKKYYNPILILLFFILASYSIYEINILNNLQQSYFSLIIRIPEFLLGGIVGIYKNQNKIKTVYSNGLGILGILIILLSAIFYTEKTIFPGINSYIPCIGTCLLLLTDQSIINRILSFNLFVYIGELSYSIYLWHWPIMAIMRYYFNISEFSFLQIIFIIISTFILSYSSYNYIEKRINYFNFRKRFIYFVLTPFILLLLIFNYCIEINNKVNYLPNELIRPVFGVNSHNTNKVETFGKIDSENNFLLIGNSHALSTKPYLNYIGMKHNFSFRTITMDTYIPVKGLSKDRLIADNEYNETSFNYYQEISKIVDDELPKHQLIILNGADFSKNNLILSLDHLINKLNSNQKLIILGTFPILKNSNLIRMNNGIVKNEKTLVEISKVLPKDSQTNIEIQKRVNNINVFYFNLSDSKVFNDIPFYNDTIMYYNGDHLNSYGAIKLAEDQQYKFVAFLNSINNLQ